MGCRECTNGVGRSVEVEYVDGTTEIVRLCDACREDFTEASFVDDVVLTEAEEE